MSILVVRLPDVGEGVAEAELVSWHVAVGDTVTPDTTVAEVLTDKATVEIYSPVNGRIASLHGTAGDVLAVGSTFIEIETDAVSAEPVTPALIDPIDASADPPLTPQLAHRRRSRRRWPPPRYASAPVRLASICVTFADLDPTDGLRTRILIGSCRAHLRHSAPSAPRLPSLGSVARSLRR